MRLRSKANYPISKYVICNQTQASSNLISTPGNGTVGTKWYATLILNKKVVNAKRLVKEGNKTVFWPTSQSDMGRPKAARSISAVLKSKILDLLQAGKSYVRVSKHYSIFKNTKKGTVRCKKLVTEGLQRWTFGRKPKLGSCNVRKFLNYVKVNSKLPVYAIATSFRTIEGSNLSDQTIRRCLHKNGTRS